MVLSFLVDMNLFWLNIKQNSNLKGLKDGGYNWNSKTQASFRGKLNYERLWKELDVMMMLQKFSKILLDSNK